MLGKVEKEEDSNLKTKHFVYCYTEQFLSNMKSKTKILTYILVGVAIILLILNIRIKPNKEHEDAVTIRTPYNFRSTKAEELSIKAFNLRNSRNYHKAILLYRQAIKIEPDNPKLFFDMSDCFFRLNNLRQAIQILDTAILLDSTFAPFYSNRGLYFYRIHEDQKALNDFLKATKLDSTSWVIYGNMALAYYSMNNLNEACAAFRLSKRFGLDFTELDNEDGLMKIRSICE